MFNQLSLLALIAVGFSAIVTNVGAQVECLTKYTVKPGDTCNGIAGNTNTSVSVLECDNPAINAGCTNLAIGQSLCIPNCASTYTVRSGDTCTSIAAKFSGITAPELQDQNLCVNAGCTNLAIGQILCIPPAPGSCQSA